MHLMTVGALLVWSYALGRIIMLDFHTDVTLERSINTNTKMHDAVVSHIVHSMS